jgi:hypothetical protein
LQYIPESTKKAIEHYNSNQSRGGTEAEKKEQKKREVKELEIQLQIRKYIDFPYLDLY